MSKDLRLARLFSYDQRFYSMFEKRFRSRCRGQCWIISKDSSAKLLKDVGVMNIYCP